MLHDINDKMNFIKNMFVEYHGFKRNNEISELLTMYTTKIYDIQL